MNHWLSINGLQGLFVFTNGDNMDQQMQYLGIFLICLTRIESPVSMIRIPENLIIYNILTIITIYI